MKLPIEIIENIRTFCFDETRLNLDKAFRFKLCRKLSAEQKSYTLERNIRPDPDHSNGYLIGNLYKIGQIPSIPRYTLICHPCRVNPYNHAYQYFEQHSFDWEELNGITPPYIECECARDRD